MDVKSLVSILMLQTPCQLGHLGTGLTAQGRLSQYWTKSRAVLPRPFCSDVNGMPPSRCGSERRSVSTNDDKINSEDLDMNSK